MKTIIHLIREAPHILEELEALGASILSVTAYAGRLSVHIGSRPEEAWRDFLARCTATETRRAEPGPSPGLKTIVAYAIVAEPGPSPGLKTIVAYAILGSVELVCVLPAPSTVEVPHAS